MLSLNSLILEIEKDTDKKKKELEKSYLLEIQKIEKSFSEEFNLLKKDLDKKLEEEKELIIREYKEEKDFEMKMKKLSLKENIVEESILKVKKIILDLPLEKKIDFYKKKIKELEKIASMGKIIVPKGKKNEIKNLFSNNIEILEKDLGIEDGFIIEGDKFSYEVTTSSIIDEIITGNKKILLSLFS